MLGSSGKAIPRGDLLTWVQIPSPALIVYIDFIYKKRKKNFRAQIVTKDINANSVEDY